MKLATRLDGSPETYTRVSLISGQFVETLRVYKHIKKAAREKENAKIRKDQKVEQKEKKK